MSQTPDKEIDALLRDVLGGTPTSRPIPNLPERAIAIAMSRHAVAPLVPTQQDRSNRTRLIRFATVLAVLAIACVWLFGIWSVFVNDVSFSTSSLGVAASASEQTADWGFAIAIFAGLALMAGWVTRSFMDSLDNATPVESRL